MPAGAADWAHDPGLVGPALSTLEVPAFSGLGFRIGDQYRRTNLVLEPDSVPTLVVSAPFD